jgi:hypothetical protein
MRFGRKIQSGVQIKVFQANRFSLMLEASANIRIRDELSFAKPKGAAQRMMPSATVGAQVEKSKSYLKAC